MIITKTSNISGKVNTMDIDVTSEQIAMWQGGKLIQHVMPHLNSGEREFLISGITPQEWDEIFGEE
jgi:hypothetical protein